MKHTGILEKGRESGYVAHCPALKGCVSQGRTKKEALKNLKERSVCPLHVIARGKAPKSRLRRHARGRSAYLFGGDSPLANNPIFIRAFYAIKYEIASLCSQ